MAHTVRLPRDPGSVAVTPGFISKDSHFTHRFTVSLLMDWDSFPAIFDYVSLNGEQFFPASKSGEMNEFESIISVDLNSVQEDEILSTFATAFANHIDSL